MTYFPTGNSDRDSAIVAAFEIAANQNAISYANVALILSDESRWPGFDGLAEDEFIDAYNALIAPPVASLSAEAGEQEANGGGDTAAPVPLTRSEAAAAIRDAGARLQEARRLVVEMAAAQRSARAATAAVVTAWQIGQPRITPEQLKRDVLEANQRERAERAARGQYGNTAATFVRKQMKQGMRRGMFIGANGEFVRALPQTQKGAFYGQIRVPSDR